MNLCYPGSSIEKTFATFIFFGNIPAAIALLIAIVIYGKNAFGFSFINFMFVLLNPLDDEYDESWNLDGLNQSIDVIFNISNELANSSQWPNWYDGNEFKSIRDISRSGK